MTHSLYHGDCLEVLRTLVSEGFLVDAIITDPPYNISQKNGFKTLKNKKGQLKDPNGLDYGSWDKDFDQLSWISIAKQLLKSSGSMLVFNDWKKIGFIVAEAERVGLIAKDLIRWEKSNPMPRNINRRYVSDCEYTAWLVVDGGKWTFNRFQKPYARPKITSPSTSGVEAKLHPTRKPLKVMMKLLEVHTSEGDTVLDPFMGSGTTGLACKLLNRNFIGIEKELKYYQVAEQEVNQTRAVKLKPKTGLFRLVSK